MGANYPGSDWYEDSYALMQEYGQKDGGVPVTSVQLSPAAAPAAAPAAVAAPAVANASDEPETKPEASKPDAEKKDEGGGWFDWF